MARWENFNIWRGRLPHWRADGVDYYVTFRHKRVLTEAEKAQLFTALLRQQEKQWRLDILCVLDEKTELVAKVVSKSDGQCAELSDIVEKAKTKAGRAIIKSSGERYPPFYFESYDRIVRDEGELEQIWANVIDAASNACEEGDPEEYRFLWMGGAI